MCKISVLSLEKVKRREVINRNPALMTFWTDLGEKCLTFFLAVQISCDFETPFVCGYVTTVNATSSFLWSRRRGGQTLPARPAKDHTRSDESGQWMSGNNICRYTNNFKAMLFPLRFSTWTYSNGERWWWPRYIQTAWFKKETFVGGEGDLKTWLDMYELGLKWMSALHLCTVRLSRQIPSKVSGSTCVRDRLRSPVPLVRCEAVSSETV